MKTSWYSRIFLKSNPRLPAYRLRHQFRRKCSCAVWMRSRHAPFTGASMKQANKLRLFGEERIVTMGAVHLAIIGRHAGGADGGGKPAHRLGREQPVGTDTDQREARLDPAKDL